MIEIVKIYNNDLSSSLKKILISSAEDKINVTIKALAPVEKQIYAATLKTYNSLATVHDLRNIISRYMRQQKTAQALFLIETAEESLQFQAIYNTRLMPSFNDKSQFLTSISMQQIHRSAPIALAAINPEADLKITVQISSADDIALQTVQIDQQQWRTGKIIIDTDQLIREAMQHIPTTAKAKPTAIIAKSGSRFKTYYLTEKKPDLTMAFRNQFNSPDIIQLRAAIKEVTVTTQQEAYIEGEATAYDRTSSRSYEVETQPLTRQEFEALQQAIESSSIYIMAPLTSGFAMVTDATIEDINDSEKYRTIKFTYKYLDRQIQADTKQEEKEKIFNGIFSTQFA